MRTLFVIIVVVAAGYLAYTYYQEHLEKALEQAEGGQPSETVTGTGQAKKASPRPASSLPAATPVFQSTTEIPSGPPGEKHLAPPGVFYMLERISAQTSSGIRAVVPGEQVKLVQRKGDTLKVTDGIVDFEVKGSQVTNDLDVARAAERKEFEAHPRNQHR